MRNRHRLFTLSLLCPASLALAPYLFGQDISSGDITLAQTRQGSSSTRPTQASPTKPSLVKPAPKPKSSPSRGLVPSQPAATPPSSNRFSVPVADVDLETEPNSEQERSHQIGALGALNFFGPGFGLEYIHHPWSWFDWGLSATSSRAAFQREKFPETQEFLKTSLLNLKGFARFFSHRLLYLGLGLNYSALEGRYGWQGSSVSRGEVASSFKAQFASVDAFLGSDWHIGAGFHLGVDWVGFGLPLTGTINLDPNEDLDLTTEFLTGGNAETRLRQEIIAQWKLYYILVHAGYSF